MCLTKVVSLSGIKVGGVKTKGFSKKGALYEADRALHGSNQKIKMWKHFFCGHMKTFKVKWHSTDVGHNFGKKTHVELPCGLFDFFKLA